MIIKEKDPIEPVIFELNNLLASKSLPERTQKHIRHEINSIKRGFNGEKDCAFYIDGFVKNHPNRVIIHDLRIEDNGDVAQIDHLFINRNLQMFVLESKNFSHGLKISDSGEFEYWNGKTYCGMPSPVEQAKRQIDILQRYLDSNNILPKRLGFTLKPEFDFYILCGTQSRIIRPEKENSDSQKVLKVDLFKKKYDTESANQSLSSGLKGAMNLVSKETLIEIATKIASGHCPLKKNYRAQFGITDDNKQKNEVNRNSITREEPSLNSEKSLEVKKSIICPHCGSDMVLRTAKKGSNSGNSFWGCSQFPKCRGIVNIPEQKNGQISK